ncbi:MAG TPA: GerMN domain-containing protein [Thermoanaerobaculia bacterium]|nr:GerMN domain-containing protein [Thermoanaerobaculia bacterium]
MKRVAVMALAMLVIAGACKKKSETAANLNAANKVAVRRVNLYYETAQMLLAPEPRNVALPESAAAAIPVVLRELVKGPAAPTSLRLFPADTVVRGAYLLPEGTVVVDLGGKTLTDGWGTGSHQELMAVYSVVQSVTANFPDAKRVRFVVNGTPAETLAGHVSLSKSLGPLSYLVDPRAR